MTTDLAKPERIEEQAWNAITEHHARLTRAVAEADWPLALGSAKELVECLAKVVLAARGEAVGSNEDMPPLINRAHVALERHPGALAQDPELRGIMQSMRALASYVPAIRNRYGTGHGQAAPSAANQELAEIVVAGSTLWVRWALKRLDSLLQGWPATLARDLTNQTFYRGTLGARLAEAKLKGLEDPDQRMLGLAVARRAMSGTFVVWDDGVEACAAAPDPGDWPDGYRQGLVEGLFFDRSGLVDVTLEGVRVAARVLAHHSDAAAVLADVHSQLNKSAWSSRFAGESDERSAIASEMQSLAVSLKQVTAQVQWRAIAATFSETVVADPLSLLPPYLGLQR